MHGKGPRVKSLSPHLKACATCRLPKPLVDFRMNRRTADRRVAHCKACELANSEERRAKERVRAQRKRMQREETVASIRRTEAKRQAEIDRVNAEAFDRMRADREDRGA